MLWKKRSGERIRVEGGGPSRLLRGTASEAEALNRVEADQAELGRKARGGPSLLRAWCWLGMGKPVFGRRVQGVGVTRVRCRSKQGFPGVLQSVSETKGGSIWPFSLPTLPTTGLLIPEEILLARERLPTSRESLCLLRMSQQLQ